MTGRPYIYGLYDADGNLRYIGKANDLQARLKSHMKDSRRRNTPLYAWIRKNGQPCMRVLIADSEDWRADETRLISEARSRGERLLNVADGGDEPKCPDHVRSQNGRNWAKNRDKSPIDRYTSKLKKTLGTLYRGGYASNHTVDRMREMAEAEPRIFGAWKDLPYNFNPDCLR